MRKAFEPYKRALLASGPILFRHVFLLVNVIIFSVVALLFLFGDKNAAIFLGIIITFNIFLGIIQDFRARVELEQLQLLTALHVVRLNDDGTEEQVFTEEIRKNDRIKVRIGDQVPCDGVLITAEGFEVSEALITGESDSFTRVGGERIFAGSIVASGVATVRVETVFAESRIARMTKDIKKYVASPSPIEDAINAIIRYSGYVLILTLLFIAARGFIVGAPMIQMVENAGALASSIVPQGLVVVTTLLFAFGAASYSHRKVLFQEINATEKLGRIRNLCMDKTGTLTDRRLSVERMHVAASATKEEAEDLMAAYLKGSGDSSETVNAVAEFLGHVYPGAIAEAVPFSSWRQYGSIFLKEKYPGTALFVGSPDIFLSHIAKDEERKWLERLIVSNSRSGKRVLCIFRSKESALPPGLEDVRLTPVAAFVLASTLREGIKDAIRFFQQRGVRIRILTGDNPETARAIASAAGVADTAQVITGVEMESWDSVTYKENAKRYTIFARVVPEQKVKIIEALKEDGFTAMVGDGANDALAIKRADLGIAMFDGAPATRQLASVVLMNNSFTALPGGVALADNFIRNIEIFASIFLNGSLMGFFFFVIMSIFGHAYPLTPLNFTIINYFSVGLPGLLISYWAVYPKNDVAPVSTEHFLARILPFPVRAAIVEACGLAIVFMLSPTYFAEARSDTLVVIAFVAFSFAFFALVSRLHSSRFKWKERWQLFLLAIIELAMFFVVLNTPLLVRFFDLTPKLPSLVSVGTTLLVVLGFVFVLYFVRAMFIRKRTRGTP